MLAATMKLLKLCLDIWVVCDYYYASPEQNDFENQSKIMTDVLSLLCIIEQKCFDL